MCTPVEVGAVASIQPPFPHTDDLGPESNPISGRFLVLRRQIPLSVLLFHGLSVADAPTAAERRWAATSDARTAIKKAALAGGLFTYGK
jgi:hypothetical protein